jgi:hypothetical protein
VARTSRTLDRARRGRLWRRQQRVGGYDHHRDHDDRVDLNDKDCLALAGIGATIAQAFSGATAGNANTEELQQLVDKVPDEIQADVQTLADAFGQYAAKLKDIGIKSGSTPSAAQLQQLQAAIASLDQQKLTAASNHIEAWAKDNCSG